MISVLQHFPYHCFVNLFFFFSTHYSKICLLIPNLHVTSFSLLLFIRLSLDSLSASSISRFLTLLFTLWSRVCGSERLLLIPLIFKQEKPGSSATAGGASGTRGFTTGFNRFVLVFLSLWGSLCEQFHFSLSLSGIFQVGRGRQCAVGVDGRLLGLFWAFVSFVRASAARAPLPDAWRIRQNSGQNK